MAVVYEPRWREYGIRVLDGGESKQLIRFCPWCGASLPDSLRDAWFDRIEQLGLEPDDPALPGELRSDDWWKTP